MQSVSECSVNKCGKVVSRVNESGTWNFRRLWKNDTPSHFRCIGSLTEWVQSNVKWLSVCPNVWNSLIPKLQSGLGQHWIRWGLTIDQKVMQKVDWIWFSWKKEYSNSLLPFAAWLFSNYEFLVHIHQKMSILLTWIQVTILIEPDTLRLLWQWC